MLYVHNAVNSSCHININVFFKKVFYRQIVLYTFVQNLIPRLQKRTNKSFNICKKEKLRTPTQGKMHRKLRLFKKKINYAIFYRKSV